MSEEEKPKGPLSQLQPYYGLGSSQSNLERALLDATMRQQESMQAFAKTRESLTGSNLYDGLFKGPNPFTYPTELVNRLQNDLTNYKENFQKVVAERDAALARGEDALAERGRLQNMIEGYEKQRDLWHISTRVRSEARAHLEASAEFAGNFSDKSPCNSYVMSIDIRRSTDLMLYARSPQHFADFIAALTRELSDTVMNHFGVIDKFTGDGLLVFFPDFFSGIDAGMHALLAAESCHRIFEKTLEEHWDGFHFVSVDVGLGIGIDHGEVTLMRVQEGLTVIGRPVVFATRLGAAPATRTFVNGQARSEILSRNRACATFERVQLHVKAMGDIWVHQLAKIEDSAAAEPEWYSQAIGRSTKT